MVFIYFLEFKLAATKYSSRASMDINAFASTKKGLDAYHGKSQLEHQVAVWIVEL